MGREVELGTLRSELACAVAGRPRVVFVEGDAGVGKSSLLSCFCGETDGACVLRAAGEESERLFAYGVIGQLLGGELPDGSLNALAVGMRLLSVIDRAQSSGAVAVVVVDDVHWAVHQSVGALLFALRRLGADRVLALVSGRPGEFVGGQGWARFVAGDPRATRVRLGGLAAGDVRALADVLGMGPLPMPVASRLVEHTGGNPLACRALLEELGPGGLRRADVVLPAPRAFASVVLSRLSALSGSAQRLVTAAAVLGERCELRSAAELGELDDPLNALEEALAAGLVREEGVGAGLVVSLSHPLTRAAIYGDLGPTTRRRLHSRAAAMSPPAFALPHRVAASAGVDDALAHDLEAAASAARGQGQYGRAAAWLEQAATVAGSGAERERLLLAALDVLVSSADVGGGLALLERMGDVAESALRGALVGELDLLAGRGARLEAHLLQVWGAHDRVRERVAGARAATTLATYLLVSGRLSEASVWAGRGLDAGSGDPNLEAVCGGLIVWCDVWFRGSEGLRRLDHLPSDPAEVPLELTEGLWLRGVARLLCDELLGAVEDLRTVAARVRAGVAIRNPSQSLGFMADAEYRLGRWDDAVVHGELAVSLSHDADRAWDYAFVHSYAAFVPAARGDLVVASAHVDAARAAAQTFGVATAAATAATPWTALADARGDYADVLEAAAEIRQTGRAELLGRPGMLDWQQLEIDALLNLNRREQARCALEQLEVVAERVRLTSALLSAAGLRGRLAAAEGDHDGADAAFAEAWGHAEGLPIPFRVAWLGLADGRRLRLAGRRRDAIAALHVARGLLVALGARPYLDRCDDELLACGVPHAGKTADPLAELTQSELAVARLVASGATNREVAAELFISVKTVEFHLRHVYAKLAIRSRTALAQRIHAREHQT